MIVRNACVEDLENLSLLFDGYRQFYQQTNDLAGARKFLEQRLTAADSVIFVVEFKRHLLGFTQLYPSFSSVSMQKLWILNDLFVAKAARSKGVATLLLNQAKAWSQATGSKGLLLETEQDNRQAQRLYLKLGYQRQDDTQHYFLATHQAS